MQTVGVLVALALYQHAETATRAFHFAVESAGGQLDDGLHLLLEVAFGDVVDELLNDVQAFEDFVETDHVAGEGVAFRAHHFVELHAVVSCVGTELAEVVVPTRGTARTTRTAEGDDLLLGEHTHSLRAVLEDDVARENVVILLDVFPHIGDELLHALHKVRVNVGHHAANRVVVQDEAAATRFLEDVEDFLTVAETVEESRRGTEVLAETAEEKDVRVDTLQFVHNRTDHLHAVAHLHAHSLLDAHTERVAVLHRAEVVKAVRQRQRLRVSHLLADLLHTTVNVAQVRVNLANAFTLQRHTEVKHTVGRGVLRTDVHHIIVLVPDAVFHLLHAAVLAEAVLRGEVAQRFVRHAERIVLLRRVVLAEGEAHPVLAHEQAAHIGVVREDDAVEVIHFTFVSVGNVP